jgi:sodium/bile acid cotransporter 7
MIVAVSFAKAFPNLGKNGSIVRPELFIGKYGVTTIFLISGISLKLQELTNAVSNVKLNGLIQLITFGAWPYLVGLPMTKGIELAFPGLLPAPLIEGLLILCCLPTTINMCIILTSAAGGSVATALCNTVISNLAGIFITPALLLRFFGKSIELPFVDLVRKLCSKVLFPVAVGQALRATPVKEFYSKHTGFFKRFQEVVLLGIVWNAFSNAFSSGLGLEGKHAVALLTLLPTLHVASLASLFSFFRWETFGFSIEEAIAATFCAAHKTLAFGLPLINTIFDGNPNLASYCAPLMIMHPLQLVIGSLVAPYFMRFNAASKKV